jgi:hypothetical protein
MPLTPDWATFFSAELGALAALTGFVVVAISINLSRILAYSWLPAPAGEALVGPVGAITATSLVLIPEQSAPLLGSEIILVGLVMVVTPIVVQARSWRAREDATPTERVMRAVMSVGFGLPSSWGVRCFLQGRRRAFLGRCRRCRVPRRGRLQRLGADDRNSALEARGNACARFFAIDLAPSAAVRLCQSRSSSADLSDRRVGGLFPPTNSMGKRAL